MAINQQYLMNEEEQVFYKKIWIANNGVINILDIPITNDNDDEDLEELISEILEENNLDISMDQWGILDKIIEIPKLKPKPININYKNFKKSIKQIKPLPESDEEDPEQDFIYSKCKTCGIRVGSHSLKESLKCKLITKKQYNTALEQQYPKKK